MEQPSEKFNTMGAPELEFVEENKTLSTPPTIHQIPTSSAQSARTLAPDQPQIDSLPEQTYVTRKDHLGLKPAWIDCEFCQRRTKTRVARAEIPKDNEEFLALLVCSISPCLFCLMDVDNEVEVQHYCTGTGCGRQITYKRPNEPIQVLQSRQQELEVSKFGSAAPQSMNHEQSNTPEWKDPYRS